MLPDPENVGVLAAQPPDEGAEPAANIDDAFACDIHELGEHFFVGPMCAVADHVKSTRYPRAHDAPRCRPGLDQEGSLVSGQ